MCTSILSLKNVKSVMCFDPWTFLALQTNIPPSGLKEMSSHAVIMRGGRYEPIIVPILVSYLEEGTSYRITFIQVNVFRNNY